MKTSLVLAALIFILLPGNAQAQCQIQTYTNYAVSASEALDTTTNDIITSVLVDGNASMEMEYGCPDSIVTQFNNNVQYITHFPAVLNRVGSVGGWSYGPTWCAICFSSYQTNEDSGPVSDGQILDFSYGGQVNCSMAGVIFFLTNLIHFEVAYTRFITSGYIPDPGPPPFRFYNISPYCTAPTNPPDWNGAGNYWVTTDPPLIPTDVVDGKTVCARVGNSGPWTCLPVGKFTGGSFNLPWPLGNCTHNP